MISDEMEKLIRQGGGIREASDEAVRQKKQYGENAVFDLSLGNPSAPAPPKVAEAMRELCDSPDLDHRYMCQAGYEEVRSRIAAFLNHQHAAHYCGEHIIMTNGIAGGIAAILKAILNPGDEVAVLRPYYPSYIGFIRNAGGNVKEINADAVDFVPDSRDFFMKITPRTKAVIVNSPNNPSGAVYSEKTVQSLTAVLKEKQNKYGRDICLISDESYRDLVYDQNTLPWWPAFYDNSVVSYSFSKGLSLPGERIGYLAVSPEMHDGGKLIQGIKTAIGNIGFVNAPAFFQKVVSKCLNEKVDIAYYEKNRSFLYEVLKKSGFECAEPKGAFYFFVRAPDGDEDRLLKLAGKRHLIFVGGKNFGFEGYVRISFCCEYEVLQRAATAFALLAEDCGLKKAER